MIRPHQAKKYFFEVNHSNMYKPPPSLYLASWEAIVNCTRLFRQVEFTSAQLFLLLRPGLRKLILYDSFNYLFPDKVRSWRIDRTYNGLQTLIKGLLKYLSNTL